MNEIWKREIKRQVMERNKDEEVRKKMRRERKGENKEKKKEATKQRRNTSKWIRKRHKEGWLPTRMRGKNKDARNGERQSREKKKVGEINNGMKEIKIQIREINLYIENTAQSVCSYQR